MFGGISDGSATRKDIVALSYKGDVSWKRRTGCCIIPDSNSSRAVSAGDSLSPVLRGSADASGLMGVNVIVASELNQGWINPAFQLPIFLGVSSISGAPADFGAFLLLTGQQREDLADAGRLVLRFHRSDEIHRMVLDAGNGWFVACRL